MGDFADAALECFGLGVRDRLVPLLSPFRYEFGEVQPEHCVVTIENLAYGGEDSVCERLRELRIPYEFLHVGDHETEPQIRLYDPDVPERYGYRAAPGEWRGAASANGEPLVASSAIDRLVIDMPSDADDVWLREALEVTTAGRWRRRFAARRAYLGHGKGASGETASGELLLNLLGRDPEFAYVEESDRYLVLFAVSYADESDPTDLGDRVHSPRDAAHWAYELTRDGGSADTQWAVFDRETGSWTNFEQSEIEGA